MKDKTFIFILAIISIFIISGFIYYKLIQKNKLVKNSLPYLTSGEKIDYFSLIGENGDEIDASTLKEDNPTLIFIFPHECTLCEKNLIIWKRIVSILEGRVNTYGIILDDMSEGLKIKEKTNLNFQLYIPADIEKFLKQFRIKSNLSQTILYDNGVRLLTLGELAAGDTKELIKFCREIY